jgi:GntR family transcriptional regulator
MRPPLSDAGRAPGRDAGMSYDPVAADPRAYRAADADGRPVAVAVDGAGNVWLRVGGSLARLDGHQAMKLGGRLSGAAHRSARHPAARPQAADDRAPVDAEGMEIAYQVIADRIAARITAGEFGPQGRLPAEADLAAWYQVSRGVISRARRELLERGLVTVQPGMGTYAA